MYKFMLLILKIINILIKYVKKCFKHKRNLKIKKIMS